jgi:hypothetical protein
MPDRPFLSGLVEATVDQPTQGQLVSNLTGGQVDDADFMDYIKHYYKRSRSKLSQYGTLPTQDYDAILRRTNIDPVEHRKSDFIPFMVRLVPPDVFPSKRVGVAQNRSVPSPQNAEVNLDLERESKSRPGAKLDLAKGPLKVQSEVEESSDEKRYLVAEAQTPGEEVQSNPVQRYESFQQHYRRAKRNTTDRSTKIVEGRKPVIEDTNPVLEPQSGNEDEESYNDFGAKENASYLNRQAEKMQEIDPLFFYINPESFDKTYSHVQSEARVRGRRQEPDYIIQHWGQEQPTISASGQIGAFLVHTTNNAGEPTGGLAVDLRRGSFAYQHLMSIYHMYRNNGHLMNANDMASIVGDVEIFYDGAVYTGGFDSFSLSQSDDTPFLMEYDFEFTVRVESDGVGDPHV